MNMYHLVKLFLYDITVDTVKINTPYVLVKVSVVEENNMTTLGWL